MRSTNTRRAADAPRSIETILAALAGVARGAARRSSVRAEGLSAPLLRDLGLRPVAGPRDSRAYARGSRAEGARRTVHEMDFAYYAALTKRPG